MAITVQHELPRFKRQNMRNDIKHTGTSLVVVVPLMTCGQYLEASQVMYPNYQKNVIRKS